MAEQLQGRVTNVSDDDLGSSLDGDHAAGATTLKVANAADFDEDGGTLVINDQQIVYASCDDDTDTITLTEGLAAAADDGDTVSVWDTLREVVAVDKIASVDVGDDYADDVEAVVKRSLVDHLVEGPRGDDGESVVLEYDDEDDEWVVVDILGLGGPRASGIQFEDGDGRPITQAEVDAGQAVLSLSHSPMDEALTCVLAGVPQRATNWTVDSDERKLTLTLSGWEEAGDALWVHYAYRRGLPNPKLVATTTGTASYDVPITAPAADEGHLLVLAILLAAGNSVSALNGYTELGVSAAVTKTVSGISENYRLGMYSRICPAGAVPVPTFTGAVRDSPWVMAAVTGNSTTVTGADVATASDVHSATVPALAGTALCVYGVLGVNPIISADGTTVAHQDTDLVDPVDQVAIAINVDNGASAATVATTDGTNKGEWMLGSIAIGGGA